MMDNNVLTTLAKKKNYVGQTHISPQDVLTIRVDRVGDHATPSHSGGGGQDSADEARIFSLLFGECDKEGTGLVDVRVLVEYIRNMQMRDRHSEDEAELEATDSVR